MKKADIDSFLPQLYDEEDPPDELRNLIAERKRNNKALKVIEDKIKSHPDALKTQSQKNP